MPVCVKLCAIGFVRVCSGHIPHHKCCSVYVISRVQIAFHITVQLHTTLNVFISHIIPSHHTKYLFYITPPFTSHHSTPHHSTSHRHCTTFHITLFQSYHMFHATSRRHLMSVTTRLASDHHILHLTTLHRSLPPTTISHHHISTIRTHHTTPTLNITAHFTPHHIPHRITPHFDFKSHHRLTSQHIVSFSTSDITGNNHTARCICRGHIVHRQGHNSDTTTFLAHHIVAFHINHFAFESHSTSHHVWNCNIPHH